MDINEMWKPGAIGGVAAIVIQFAVRSVAPASNIAYIMGFVTMIVGGFIAGWMIKEKQDNAIGAGALSGLTYSVLGVLIIFPILSGIHFNAIAAVVAGVVLGAIGGFAGQFVARGSAKSSGKKK